MTRQRITQILQRYAPEADDNVSPARVNYQLRRHAARVRELLSAVEAERSERAGRRGRAA